MNRRSFFTRAIQAVAGAAVAVKTMSAADWAELAKPVTGIRSYYGAEKVAAGYRTYIMGKDAMFTDSFVRNPESIYWDKEQVENFKAEHTIFEQVSQRRLTPMNMGPTKQLFQYKTKI